MCLRTSHPGTEGLGSEHRGTQYASPKGLVCKPNAAPRVGQPRVVAAITGGGGLFFADLLREPGASSCLLEGVVPYDKHSCLSILQVISDHI